MDREKKAAIESLAGSSDCVKKDARHCRAWSIQWPIRMEMVDTRIARKAKRFDFYSSDKVNFQRYHRWLLSLLVETPANPMHSEL